ncbi:hypothetical protein [Streptomyces sp. NPDC001076]
MALVLLAGVLGAAVLAIVLLYKNQQRQTARLTKIEAEFAAEKIARLTQQLVPPAIPTEEEEPPEPSRRKRHLALYIGGGVAALLSSLGRRLRSIWKRSPALATTGTVTVVAVASTAAALCLTPNGATSDTPHSPQPATAPNLPRAEPSRTAAPPAGFNSPDDDGTGPNSAPYKSTKISKFTLTSATGEPPEPAAGETEHPSQNQPSTPSGLPTHGTSPSHPGTSPSPPGSGPSNSEPPTPASLSVGNVSLADTEQRWCEDVTVEFHNTGGSPATTGTVTFGTHILDSLGIDWHTVTQTRDLPTPIPADGEAENTWTLCVDSWRVPLGWHIDTLDVTTALN